MNGASRYLEAFSRDPRVPASVRRHLEVAQGSMRDDKRRVPLFRTLEEWELKQSDVPTYAEVAALGSCNALNVVNCHNGQRKLTMSVLEFLCVTLDRLKCDPAHLVVVYAGASGLAATIAARLFPTIKFVLYDPAPNTTELIDRTLEGVEVRTQVTNPPSSASASKFDWGNNRVIVYSGDAGWFTDEVAAYLERSLTSDKKTKTKKTKKTKTTIAFISDIRVSNDEESIVKDMLNQQRWTAILGASAYMFKFRVPYDAGLLSRYRANPSDLPTDLPNNVMPYLDGRLYIQLYPRPTTAELRLIGFRASATHYRIRMYDTREIEGRMALFNLVYRSNARFLRSKSAKNGGEKAEKAEKAMYEEVAEASILEAVARLSSGASSVEAVRSAVDAAMGRFIQGKSSMEACAVATSRSGKGSKKGCRNGPALERIAAISRLI